MTETVETRSGPGTLRAAAEQVVAMQFASAALLMRKLRVPCDRAKQLLIELEAAGVVGPQRSGRSRQVLVTRVPDEVRS